jgi:hypothetical protein
MENKLNRSISILAVTVLILTACTRSEDQAETADQRFRQSMDWNEAHHENEISLPASDYTILAMGDSHTGTTRNLKSFFRLAKSGSAAAVVLLGDLTGGKSSDYDVFQKAVPPVDSLLSFPIAGNHDLWYGNWKEYYSRFGSSTYFFLIRTPGAEDLFICLENAAGTLGEKQLDWLETILKTRRSDYRHCIVFTHCNILRPRQTESTSAPVEEIEVLLDLFNRYNVELVVTAHDHKHDVEVLGKTSYIIVDALEDGLSYAGYLRINATHSGLTYNFEHFN